MNDKNKIVLAGRLTADAVNKKAENGNPYFSFQIANNRYKKKSDGEFNKETGFYNVIYFPQKVEEASAILKKGKHIQFEGKLSQSKVTNKEGKSIDRIAVFTEKLELVQKESVG